MSAFDLMKEFTKTTEFDFVRVAPSPLSNDIEEKHRSDAQFLLEIFGKRGPGLVSEFRVGREFLEGTTNSDPTLEGSLDQDLYKEIVTGLKGERKNTL